MKPRLWLAVVLASVCVACDVSEQAPSAGALKPEYDSSGRLTKLEYDRNQDGKIETWGYMDGARVVRVEVDENGDGTVDRWEHHRGAAATSPPPAGAQDPTIERVELATRRDGKVSRREYFERGVLVKAEEDTDGDAQIDKWESYRDGALVMMALDTQGKGQPDRRLIYKPDGSFDHLETDLSGSGSFKAVIP